MHLADSLLTPSWLLAAGGPSPPFQFAIVLFFTILGLLVTLSPPRRTYEVKKPKDE
jgi:hypothetical protein